MRLHKYMVVAANCLSSKKRQTQWYSRLACLVVHHIQHFKLFASSMEMWEEPSPIPRPLPDFITHNSELKSGSGLGMRLKRAWYS